jgi:hypothetical protein
MYAMYLYGMDVFQIMNMGYKNHLTDAKLRYVLFQFYVEVGRRRLKCMYTCRIRNQVGIIEVCTQYWDHCN